eukprot:5808985-Karenia_brevis.AAC.1
MASSFVDSMQLMANHVGSWCTRPTSECAPKILNVFGDGSNSSMPYPWRKGEAATSTLQSHGTRSCSKHSNTINGGKLIFIGL